MNSKKATAIVFLTAAALAGCRHLRSGSSSKEAGGQNGSGEALYTGYHKASHRYIDRACLVPDSVMVNGRVQDQFLLPPLFSKPGAQEQVVKWLPNQNARFEYLRGATSSQVLSSLAGGLNVSMEFGAGSTASGAASMAFASGSTEHTQSWTYIVHMQAGSYIALPATGTNAMVVTDYGREVAKMAAAGASAAEKRAIIDANCGNQFVSGIDVGGIFAATMKVTAALESDMRAVEGQLDVQLKGVGQGHGEAATSNYHSGAKLDISLTAYQLGGDPVAFATLLGTHKNASQAGLTDAPELPEAPAKLDAPAPIRCDITASNQDCNGLFQQILGYATNADLLHQSLRDGSSSLQCPNTNPGSKCPANFKINLTNFGGQFNNNTHDGFAIIGYSLQDYKEADIAVLVDLATKSELALADSSVAEASSPAAITNAYITANITLKLDPIYENYVNIWAYTNDVAGLFNQQQTLLDINSVRADIIGALGEIRLAYHRCRVQPAGCADIVAKTLESVNKTHTPSEYLGIANRIMQSSINGFEQYCQFSAASEFWSSGLQPAVSPWRQSMTLLARKTGASELVGSKSALTYYFTNDALAKNNGNLPQDIFTFCSALNDRVSGLTALDFRDLANSRASGGLTLNNLTLEPLAYVPSLGSLTVSKTTTNRWGLPALLASRSLTELTLHEPIIDNAWAFTAMKQLTSLTVYNPFFTDIDWQAWAAQHLPADGSGSSAAPDSLATSLAGNLVRRATAESKADYMLKVLLEKTQLQNILIRNEDGDTGGVSGSHAAPAYQFDLSLIPQTFLAGYWGGGRIMNYLSIRGTDDGSGLEVRHAEQLFGWQADNQANPPTCSRIPQVTETDVVNWTPRQMLLNLAQDPSLAVSGCCSTVVRECQKTQKRADARASKLGKSSSDVYLTCPDLDMCSYP